MSIVGCYKKPLSDTVRRNGNQISYGETWIVRTSGPTDGIDLAARASGLPCPGWIYGSGVARFQGLSGSKTSESADGSVFEFSIDYSNSAGGGSSTGSSGQKPGDELIENPLQRAPKKTWRSGSTDAYPQKDLDGKAIVNPAGEPFREGVAIPEPYGILTITRNEAAFDDKKLIPFLKSTNLFKFYGWATGLVKCESITASTEYENGREFVSVTYEFHFNIKGWLVEKLNEGSFSLDPETLEPLYPKDKNGVTALRSVLLNENGIDVTYEGDIYQNPQTAKEISYSTFRRLRSTNFTTLGLE